MTTSILSQSGNKNFHRWSILPIVVLSVLLLSVIAVYIFSTMKPSQTSITLSAPVAFINDKSTLSAAGGEVLFRFTWEPTDSGCYYDGLAKYGKIEIKMPTTIGRDPNGCSPKEAYEIAKQFLDDVIHQIEQLTHDHGAVQFLQKAGDAVLGWISTFI